ncbi:MAG: hypothetical protein ACP5IB_06495 [Thermoplasmata archaeon]
MNYKSYFPAEIKLFVKIKNANNPGNRKKNLHKNKKDFKKLNFDATINIIIIYIKEFTESVYNNQ